MKIISGLFDRMVLQRGERNRCDSAVRGNGTPGADVFLRINRKSWKRVARVSSRGEFQFQLVGLPAGGPYHIELETRAKGSRAESLSVRDVLVGDVWLAGGQSNMQGVGLLKFAEKPQREIRAFYMTDRWNIAKDTIHEVWNAVDAVHHTYERQTPNPKIGTGPAIGFAAEMQRQTGVPQGIIACAHGARSMNDWKPNRQDRGKTSLYGAMLRRLEKNGGKTAGLIWYQGESDAVNGEAAQYTAKMKQFVRSLRKDARSSRLPIVAVQISRCTFAEFPFWNSIQEQQRHLPDAIDRLAMVPAIDLRLEDAIHIGGTDNNRLGRRMARAMLKIISPRHRSIQPPIALKRCHIEQDPIQPYANVVVEFENVEGHLKTDGSPRAAGFFIRSDPPAWDEVIYDTRLDRNRVILCTRCLLAELPGRSLHYGFATNPFCNIIDEADRSLPAFGPVRLVK